MYQLLLVLCFIAMILIPAFVAALSAQKEFDRKKQATPVAAPVPVQAAARVRQPAKDRLQPDMTRKNVILYEAPTLPVHRTLGMAGR
jgi:hypothetical protein